MIIRTRQSTRVCLECQLRLSGQLPARQSPFSTPLSRQGRFRRLNLQATSRLSQAQDGSHSKQSEEHRAEAVEASRDADSTTNKSSSSAPDVAAQPVLRRRVSPFPLGRLYGLNGSKLRERAEELPVHSLGQPTKVIVLRDAQSMRYVPSRPLDEMEKGGTVDILAQFNSERGLVGRDEVNDNIESLRPQKNMMSWKGIRSVEDELGDGFTMAQLLWYIECFEKQRMAAKGEKSIADGPTYAPQKELHDNAQSLALGAEETSQSANQLLDAKGQNLIIRESPWMPGTSDQGDHFDESALRGYVSESFTPKQRVVMNLMRLCWNIEAKKFSTSVGEVELVVGSADLELLISPKGMSDPPLKTVSDELIQTDEEKIEVFRSRHAIRITATKAKAQTITQGIRSTLEGVHRIEVPLEPLKALARGTKGPFEGDEFDEFGGPVLAELARLTNSEVVETSKDKLKIHGMGRKPGSSLSTSADVARRLLLSSSDAADRTIVNHGYKVTDSPAYAVDYEYHHIMSWRNRLRRWTRWQTAIGKTDPNLPSVESDKNQVPEPPSITEPEPVDSQLQGQIHANLPVSPGNEADRLHEKAKKLYELEKSGLWKTTPVTLTTATVGNVLHQASSEPGVFDLSKPVAFDGREIKQTRTLFAPSTKNLSRLISGMNKSSTPSSSLIMKFLPSPWPGQNGKSLKKFPPLEMHFDISRTAENRFNLSNMIATTEDVCNDVMLPDKTLDIRFRQKTFFPFDAANLEHYPQITEFLEASQLGQRVNVMTPPELVVPIPTFMCNAKSGMKASDASTDVRYLFAGLAYQTHASYDFQNWELRYSSINSGKADGRRAELTLHPTRSKTGEPRAADKDRTLDQELTLDYINSAYALVDTLDTLEQPVLRMVGSEPSRGLDSKINYEFLPSVRYCEASSANNMPQQFRYLAKHINFGEETEATA